MKRFSAILASFDWSLFLGVLALTVIGLIAIYGIGVSRSGDIFQFRKQLLAAIIGIIAIGVIACIDYRHIRSFSIPLYLLGLIPLILVLIIGSTSRNAGRWFVLGPLSFQPVEFAKVTLAIFLASYLSRFVRQRLRWTAFIGSMLATAPYVVLVLLQPDFGSAMVLVAIWGVSVFFCGLPRWALPSMLLIVCISLPLVWEFGLRPYQKDRLLTFLSQSHDPRGASYNVVQAHIAIGSGGWFGKGIGEGTQSRLRFLPEASTDFMFAVIGEELGFVGSMVVLLLFGFILYRYLAIAQHTADPYVGILHVSLGSIILIHVTVNAGMNLGVVPVTGIPLPFVSAAASSVVTMLLNVGVAESAAVHSKPLLD